jgi:LacI family transcriptional regulator
MTVREIAKLAGVSIGTVDRVLYRRGRVSPETKARVEEIIEEYQFTPNPIARRLKRNKSYRFCALIPRRDQDSGYWGQALSGIENGAMSITALGVETEIIEYDRYDQQSFYAAAEAILRNRPDGLIFAPVMPDRTRPFIEKIHDEQIPYVFFDADLPEMEPLCVIGHDSFKSGYLGGRLMHLFAGKITMPAFVLDAHGEDYHIRRRRDGFLSFAEEHTFPVLCREYSGYTGAEISEQEMTCFMLEKPAISGIFVTNSMAHRVAEVAKWVFAERDFFIIGYDLIPRNRLLLGEGSIDAIIDQRPAEQGRQALINLYRCIVLEQQIEQKIRIPIDIYLRENIPEEPKETASSLNHY